MLHRPNLMSPEVQRNPYPLYAELRQGPIRQVDPGGMWAVSRYDDVLAVLKDTQRFSSTAIAGTRKPPWLARNAFGDTNLVSLDPPAHGRMRALVSPAFTGAALARLELFIRNLAEDLAERAVRKGEVDFMAEFAN